VAVNCLHNASQGSYKPKAEKCYESPILPLKLGIDTFSIGICLAKYLTQNISATIQDIGLVSKDHLQETISTNMQHRLGVVVINKVCKVLTNED